MGDAEEAVDETAVGDEGQAMSPPATEASGADAALQDALAGLSTSSDAAPIPPAADEEQAGEGATASPDEAEPLTGDAAAEQSTDNVEGEAAAPVETARSDDAAADGPAPLDQAAATDEPQVAEGTDSMADELRRLQSEYPEVMAPNFACSQYKRTRVKKEGPLAQTRLSAVSGAQANLGNANDDDKGAGGGLGGDFEPDLADAVRTVFAEMATVWLR